MPEETTKPDESLTALEQSQKQLEERLAAILARLAAAGGKDPELEAEHAGIMARLAALPVARDIIEKRQRAQAHKEALARYEELQRGIYERQEQRDALQADLARARAAAAEIEGKIRALRHANDAAHAKLANLVMNDPAGKRLSSAETAAIARRWNYVGRDYPNRDRILRRRAERGDLPPGVTLESLGVEPESD